MPDDVRPHEPLTSENAALVLVDHRVPRAQPAGMPGIRFFNSQSPDGFTERRW
jgi:hypothetical protein